MPAVVALRTSPVKGLQQEAVDALALVPGGIAGDRRFLVADADDRALYGANLTALPGATATWDAAADELAIRFGDGEVVSGRPVDREEVVAHAYGPREIRCRRVDGPWAAALSARAGQPLRLRARPSASPRPARSP